GSMAGQDRGGGGEREHEERDRERARSEGGPEIGANRSGLQRNTDAEHEGADPEPRTRGPRSLADDAGRPVRQECRAMGTEAGEDDEADGQRVPIEQTDVAARSKVGEEGHVELAPLVERDATDDVAESHTEDEDEQAARHREDETPEGGPERMV